MDAETGARLAREVARLVPWCPLTGRPTDTPGSTLYRAPDGKLVLWGPGTEQRAREFGLRPLYVVRTG